MSNNCVREALLASVAWTLPPVRLNSSQELTVPAQRSPAFASARACGIGVEQPADLRRREKRVEAESGLRDHASSSTSGLRIASIRSAERRHCQVTHGPIVSPVDRRHSSTDLALVGDADRREARVGRQRGEATFDRLDRRAPDLRARLLDPAGPRIADRRRHGMAGGDPRPAASSASALVLVVPWSMARMKPLMACAAGAIASPRGARDSRRGQPERLEQELDRRRSA